MRAFFLSLGLFALSSAALAQEAGPLAGPAPDIRGSDMDTHDSSANPDLHDQLISQRARELSDRVRAQNQGGGSARQAKREELTAGAVVNDKTGVAMAKIDEVDPDGVVVSDGAAKVKVPAEAFGHNKAGLLLDMTKAEFEKVVASANAAS